MSVCGRAGESACDTKCVYVLMYIMGSVIGCDCSADLIRDAGVWDTQAYELEMAFGYKLGMTKTQRLIMGDSVANHAMVIAAVHVDEKNGRPVRYKVENSWSDTAGEKGYFMMTAEWFRQ